MASYHQSLAETGTTKTPHDIPAELTWSDHCVPSIRADHQHHDDHRGSLVPITPIQYQCPEQGQPYQFCTCHNDCIQLSPEGYLASPAGNYPPQYVLWGPLNRPPGNLHNSSLCDHQPGAVSVQLSPEPGHLITVTSPSHDQALYADPVKFAFAPHTPVLPYEELTSSPSSSLDQPVLDVNPPSSTEPTPIFTCQKDEEEDEDESAQRRDESPSIDASSPTSDVHIRITNMQFGRWGCDICQQEFRRKSRAQSHFLNKHGGMRLACHGCCGKATCEKTFACQEALDTHTRPVMIQCECGRTLLKKNIRRHRKEHCHIATGSSDSDE